MAALRGGVILTIYLLMTFVLLPVQWLAVKLGLGLRSTLPRFYHRQFCRLVGIRITVVGEPVAGGLMAANHSSWLDIPVLSAIAPVSFVAKTEVGRWPFFGTLARLQRTIFVQRERGKALEASDAIRRRLVEGGTLVLFPEGTSSDGNRVLPFKSSLLSAAELGLGEDAQHHEKHAAIQPVSISYVALHGVPMGRENRPFFAWYGDMDLVSHLWDAFKLGPVDVVVEFHPVLSVDQAGGRKPLASAAERLVRQGVARALSGRLKGPPAPPGQDDALIEALGEAGAEEAA